MKGNKTLGPWSSPETNLTGFGCELIADQAFSTLEGAKKPGVDAALKHLKRKTLKATGGKLAV